MNWTKEISQEAADKVKKAGYVDPTANHHLISEAAAEAHTILGQEIFLAKDHACEVSVQIPKTITDEFQATYDAYKLIMMEMEAIHPANKPELTPQGYDRLMAGLQEKAAPLRSKLYSLEMVLVSIVQAQI